MNIITLDDLRSGRYAKRVRSEEFNKELEMEEAMGISHNRLPWEPTTDSDSDGVSSLDGCPHCGSYEGDATECPECGHGQ